jgi:hypothetical protein
MTAGPSNPLSDMAVAALEKTGSCPCPKSAVSLSHWAWIDDRDVKSGTPLCVIPFEGDILLR